MSRLLQRRNRLTRELLSPIERQALELLVLPPGVYLRVSEVGRRLWGAGRGHSSCPMARPAGALMRRLQDRGLVEQGVQSRDGEKVWMGFHTSWRGRQLLESAVQVG